MATTQEEQELLDAIRDALDAEDQYLEAEAFRKKTRERLVNLLLLRDQREASVEDDEDGYQVKVVAPERTTINDEELIRCLGKRAYNKLTERKADKDKVLALLRTPGFDPERIRSAIVIAPVSPYPKITRYEPDHGE